MWQKTFKTFDECFENDLWESMNDANELGLLHFEQVSRFWYEKERGAKWLLDIPEIL